MTPLLTPPSHLRSLEYVDTPHGRCVLIALDDDELDAAFRALPSQERAFADTLSAVRRRELIVGRTALHLAADDFDAAFLPSPRGAPQLSGGRVGSVSHKGTTAAAIVADAGVGWIGIDLEHAAPPKQDIALRILTEREQRALPDRGRAVTLRFAIKEAIYKAVDPIVQRFVGFVEVELEVGGDGSCAVASQLPVEIEATWREHGPHWIATARAIRRTV